MKLNIITALIIVSVFLTACGGGGAGDLVGANVSTTSGALSYIPAATGEVVGGESLSIASLTRSISPLAATTGLKLSSAGSTTFQIGDSKAMCETSNAIKNVLEEVSQPDKILCYMSTMASTGVVPNNLVDGNWHYMRLINLPGESTSNAEPLVKFKITLTDGRLSDFKMYSCFSGTTASPIQSEYISQTFTSSTVSIVSKYSGSEGSATYGSSTNASGSLNPVGEWTAKSITGKNYYSDGGDTFEMQIDGSQTADTLTFAGYNKGSFSSATFGSAFYSVVQILNDSRLNTLALGDGTAKYNISFDPDGVGGAPAFTESGTESWNGDTLLPLGTASDGDYFTAANAGTLPAVPGSVTAVTFDSDETWDCTLPEGESWISADFTVGGAAVASGMTDCESNLGFGNRDWISCDNVNQ